MTKIRVQYAVHHNSKLFSPLVYGYELTDGKDYPYQIVEYNTDDYSFDGDHLMEPMNETFQTVFGAAPFEIETLYSLSQPYVKVITPQTIYSIPHENVLGVQLENIDPEPSLDYDMDMIVYVKDLFDIEFLAKLMD